MKKILNEFKEFALKGSMFDMAIGVIMGGAVSKVVGSMVNDLITPLISLIAGNQASLAEKAWIVGEVSIKYGSFISVVIDFLITALVIFLMVKLLNSFRKKKEEQKPAATPEPNKTEILLQEILEELRKNK